MPLLWHMMRSPAAASTYYCKILLLEHPNCYKIKAKGTYLNIVYFYMPQDFPARLGRKLEEI